jgi:hypothetical protein
VLSRPWCLLELQAAVQGKVPIIVIRVANLHQADPDGIGAILDDLPKYLAEANPDALAVLQGEVPPIDAAALGHEIRDAIVGADVVSFEPHQSSVMLQVCRAWTSAAMRLQTRTLCL